MGIGTKLVEWLGGPVPETAQPRAEITTSKQLEEVFIASGVDVRSGVTVTPEGAMAVAAVASAVGVIAESVAQLPLVVFRRLEEGGKDRATDHPMWRLLRERPNGWQTAFEFRELLQTHLSLFGNAYALKSRARGRIVELLPLHPMRVEVEQQDDFSLIYKVTVPGQERRLEFTQRDIFHIRDRGFDGVRGNSRIKQNREVVGLAKRMENYSANFFGNSARPSGILTTAENLSDEQMMNIRDSWKAAHGGDNTLGTAVLDGGMDFKAMSMSSKDAELLEMRKFQISEISRIFRVPPHMLGDLERATFSNIEQQSLEFVRFTLEPWLQRWQDAVNIQLIDEVQQGRFFAEFVREGLLRGTTKERFESYQIALQNGWMTRNEVRERENLNPIDGGDEITPAESLFGGGEQDQGGENGQDQPASV